MAHPKDVRRRQGKIWHKEDDELNLVEARSLKKHLKKTEEKNARISKTPSGYQVWWSAK